MFKKCPKYAHISLPWNTFVFSFCMYSKKGISACQSQTLQRCDAGGGWLSGMWGAQEEGLMRRSSLYLSLWPLRRPGDELWRRSPPNRGRVFHRENNVRWHDDSTAKLSWKYERHMFFRQWQWFFSRHAVSSPTVLKSQIRMLIPTLKPVIFLHFRLNMLHKTLKRELHFRWSVAIHFADHFIFKLLDEALLAIGCLTLRGNALAPIVNWVSEKVTWCNQIPWKSDNELRVFFGKIAEFPNVLKDFVAWINNSSI